MLPAPLEIVAGLFSSFYILKKNGSGATPIASSMCFGKRRSMDKKLQMRMRHCFVIAGRFLCGATRSNEKADHSDFDSKCIRPEAEALTKSHV